MIGILEATAAPLLVMIAIVLAVSAGDVVAARRKLDVRSTLWVLAASALLCARLVYVWQFHKAYFDAPWRILDLRDGGWSVEGGFVGLWLISIWMARRRPTLKWPIRTAVFSGTLLWSVGAAALAAHDVAATGADLPAIVLPTQAGTSVDLRSLRGKPVVVNLWATWCPPCNREMPVLAQAQAERPDVQFVFIDQGESLMEVGRWIGDHKLALRNVMLDPHLQAGAALGQRAFPTTYFFDASGHLVDRRIGELSPAVLTDKLQRIAPHGG